LAAAFVLAVLPLLLLWPVLVGDHTYLPFDVARFPPHATTLLPDQYAAIGAQRMHQDVTEIPALVLPEIELARRELEEGRFPHWNPYARFGAPLFANSLAALVYPPNWLLLVSSEPSHGLGLAAYLSFLIAGLGMLAFLREVRLSVLAALFGAVAFQLSGTLLANGHFYMRMNALIWLPIMLLACLRLAHQEGKDRIPACLGLALGTALSLCAGFPPFAFASLAVAAGYGAILVGRQVRSTDARSAAALAAWLGLGATLGIAMACVQVVPMLGFFPESNRTQNLVPDAIASQAFDPMGFVGYVLRDAFARSDGSAPDYQRTPLAWLLWSRHAFSDGRLLAPHNYNFTEYAVFPGTLTVLLALAGAIGGGSRLRWPVLGIGTALVVLAVAPSWLAPLYSLPGLRQISPMRFIGPMCVVVAALAATGFDALVHGAGTRRWRVAAAVGLGLAAACVVLRWLDPLGDKTVLVARLAARWSIPADEAATYLGDANLSAAAALLRENLVHAAIVLAVASLGLALLAAARRHPRRFRALALLAIGATAAELLAFGKPLNSGRVPAPREPAVHDFLRRERDRHAVSGGITIARAAPSPTFPIDLPAGSLFPERIRDLNAYAFVDGWSHRAFQALYGHAQMIRGYWPLAFPDDSRLGRTFFDLVGLRYVLSSKPLGHAGTRVGPELRGPGGEFFVYERAAPLPRAFVVHDAVTCADDDEVVARLVPDLERGLPELDPLAQVFVTPDAAAVIGVGTASTSARGGSRAVRFRADLPSEIVLEVEPGEPGYLVLADSCLSGWNATVNGDATAHARANLFMRAVPVPAHGVEVRYTYRTPGLDAGVLTTLAALFAALALAGSWLGSRRRRGTAEV
jgi:hypothetical protein